MKVDPAWNVRYRSSANAWAECGLGQAGGIAFERCAQVRERRGFRGSSSKRGWYYFATTGQLKWCESRFEMRVLRLLDYDPGVVAVGVQPFVLNYRDEVGRASHTPDVFVRHADGTGGVVDARPERFTDEADFVRQRAATELACAETGWSSSPWRSSSLTNRSEPVPRRTVAAEQRGLTPALPPHPALPPTPTTREEWNRYVDAPTSTAPSMLGIGDYRRLSDTERVAWTAFRSFSGQRSSTSASPGSSLACVRAFAAGSARWPWACWPPRAPTSRWPRV